MRRARSRNGERERSGRRRGRRAGGGGRVAIEQRIWFNEANTSTWFLVPGLIVLIMTLIGALLTSLVMAREWERGTLEALFVTPVRPAEILLAKIVPYFVVGTDRARACACWRRGFCFACRSAARCSLILLASMLYLLVSLGSAC